jgi:hypothetical protein
MVLQRLEQAAIGGQELQVALDRERQIEAILDRPADLGCDVEGGATSCRSATQLIGKSSMSAKACGRLLAVDLAQPQSLRQDLGTFRGQPFGRLQRVAVDGRAPSRCPPPAAGI